jgi:hypothetical protein
MLNLKIHDGSSIIHEIAEDGKFDTLVDWKVLL